MKKAKLIVLRHGQTEYNAQRLMTGRRDIPLTTVGEEQAKEAGRLLKDIPINKVYSSPLSRAFNTAALALKEAGQNLPIEKCDAIIELDAGDFSGRNIDKDPLILNFQRTYGRRVPGGESDKDVVARVQKVYDEDILPRLRRGETVLLVCHSGTTHALEVVVGVAKAPADDEKLVVARVPNAAPMIHDYEDGVRVNSYFIENKKTTAANKNLPPAGPK